MPISYWCVFSQLSPSANASDENILEWNPENERTGGYSPPPVHLGGIILHGHRFIPVNYPCFRLHRGSID